MNQRLHILFLSSWYPSRVLPNNGDFIQRHAEAVALKHRVTVVHVVGDDTLKKDMDISDTNHNNVRTLVAYFKSSTNPIIKLYRFLNAYFKLLRKLGEFDIVHLNVIFPAGIIALYLNYFKKIPFIISEHWHGYHKPYCNKIGFGTQLLLKYCTKKAAVICPVTDNLGRSMQLFGLKGHYLKISNVVDTALFKPVKKEGTVFKIIHISSMDKVKNVPEILKVIAQLQEQIDNFKFYLIGNNATDYKALSAALGISKSTVIFVNQVPQKKLVNYLQQADVLVLFSHTENAPCVILEAFACGVPVISTHVGGVSEHFPENFGTLIPKNDSKALLKTLIHHAKQPKKTPKNDMYNYTDKNFSPSAIAKQFTKVYLSVLNK